MVWGKKKNQQETHKHGRSPPPRVQKELQSVGDPTFVISHEGLVLSHFTSMTCLGSEERALYS
jgi:hypothetical protein